MKKMLAVALMIVATGIASCRKDAQGPRTSSGVTYVQRGWHSKGILFPRKPSRVEEGAETHPH